jgi:hypothetical protein
LAGVVVLAIFATSCRDASGQQSTTTSTVGVDEVTVVLEAAGDGPELAEAASLVERRLRHLPGVSQVSVDARDVSLVIVYSGTAGRADVVATATAPGVLEVGRLLAYGNIREGAAASGVVEFGDVVWVEGDPTDCEVARGRLLRIDREVAPTDRGYDVGCAITGYISNTNIVTTRVIENPGPPIQVWTIELELDIAAQESFSSLLSDLSTFAQADVRRRMAFVVDGWIVWDPLLGDPVPWDMLGSGVLEVAPLREQRRAEMLAAILSAGPLPIPLTSSSD